MGVYNGKRGNDVLRGSKRDDFMDGREGDDTLYGGLGNDTLYGSAGADTLFGEDGHDALDGGIGNDVLCGGNDNDRITGGDGADILYGDNGDDQLGGFAGDDFLYGGVGTDELIGHEGNDVLSGGAGADSFIFIRQDDSAGTGDVIVDFAAGEDRLLALNVESNWDANQAVNGIQFWEFVGNQPGSALANGNGRATVVTAAGQTALAFYNADGDDVADFVLRLDGSFSAQQLHLQVVSSDGIATSYQEAIMFG